jgi:hypothetical protein
VPQTESQTGEPLTIQSLAKMDLFKLALDVCIETENIVWDMLLTKLNDDLSVMLDEGWVDPASTDAFAKKVAHFLKIPYMFTTNNSITGNELIEQMDLLNAPTTQYGGDPLSIFTAGIGGSVLALLGLYQLVEEQCMTISQNYRIIAGLYNEGGIYVYLFDLATLQYKLFLNFPQLRVNLNNLQNSLVQFGVTLTCLHDETNSLMLILLHLLLFATNQVKKYIATPLSTPCVDETGQQHTPISYQCISQQVYKEMQSELTRLIISKKKNTAGKDSPFYIFLFRLQNIVFTPTPNVYLQNMLSWLVHDKKIVARNFVDLNDNIERAIAALKRINLDHLDEHFNAYFDQHKFELDSTKASFGDLHLLVFSIIEQLIVHMQEAKNFPMLIPIDRYDLKSLVDACVYIARNIRFTQITNRELVHRVGRAIEPVTFPVGSAVGSVGRAVGSVGRAVKSAIGFKWWGNGGGPLQTINDLIVDTFLQLYWVCLFKDEEKIKEILLQIGQNIKTLVSFTQMP